MSEERYYLVVVCLSQNMLAKVPRTEEELADDKRNLIEGINYTYNAKEISKIESTDMHVYIVTTNEKKDFEGDRDFADDIGLFLNVYVNRYGDWYLVTEISKEAHKYGDFLCNFRGGYQGNRIERTEFNLNPYLQGK